VGKRPESQDGPSALIADADVVGTHGYSSS
jgi:hypothetical protein